MSSISFSSRRGRIYAASGLREAPFELKGINWFGFEGKGAVADGLWERKLADYLDELGGLNFNAIRLPLAVDNVLDNAVVGRWSLTANEELRGMRSVDLVERLVRTAVAAPLVAPNTTRRQW